MKKTRVRSEDKAIIVKKLNKNFETTVRDPGLSGVIKSFFNPKKKTVNALLEVSFSIDKGELVGFIGPNGAGKTTTLKTLSGLLYPTSGFVHVLENDPWQRKPEFLKKISLIMGQKNQLWWDLPAIETMELNQAIYEIPTKKYKETLDTLTEILDVKDLLNTQVRKLSLGQRMRMELIAALLHEPEILFLDEPTIGLDVVGQQTIRDFIFEYNKKFQATIILTSHNMTDLVDLAKRVIVIDKGTIIFDGELKGLLNEYVKEKIIRVYLSKQTDLKKFESIGEIVRINYPQVTIKVPREVIAVASAEVLQNFPVADLTIEEESIEQVIGRVFKGSKQ